MWGFLYCILNFFCRWPRGSLMVNNYIRQDIYIRHPHLLIFPIFKPTQNNQGGGKMPKCSGRISSWVEIIEILGGERVSIREYPRLWEEGSWGRILREHSSREILLTDRLNEGIFRPRGRVRPRVLLLSFGLSHNLQLSSLRNWSCLTILYEPLQRGT